MHQAEPYGHLIVNGKPIRPQVLARMVGASIREVERWISELEAAGVFNREGATIISRRMVRDERVRRLRAEGGKLGGNPSLKDNRKEGGKDVAKVGNKVNLHANLGVNPKANLQANLGVNPHISESYSESESESEVGSEVRVGIDINADVVGGAPSAERSPPAKRITFDTSTWDFVGIVDADIKRWSLAYPAVDIRVEIAKAAAWLKENPKNRKSNYGRFLVNWLSRSQDRAPARGNGTTSVAHPARNDCEYADTMGEICGMPNAKPDALYSGKRLCPHHQGKIRSRTEMPENVRDTLAKFKHPAMPT